MMIASASIPLHYSDAASASGVRALIEALQEVAQSRSTRDLFRLRAESKVACIMRVPLTSDEYKVETIALGRALRKVVREAIGKAKPGDRLVVDFRIGLDSRLHIELRPADERGPDASVFEHFHWA
ncbi:hypothetical protein N5C81_23180 [Rhizobium pusense]|uniref:hypothetical protein n=1 Tax=Agrobacterium pusense TaxID=648995 RepID=UPI00244A77DD|nr:hypothetical protein [Agrobacterium pusense]MDH1270523.1 hypothetical protein [Agrobacterium pusense]